MVYETGPQDNQDQALEGLLRVCRRLLNAWKNYMNVDASAAVSSLALGPSAFEEKLAEATMNLTMKYVMKSQNLFSSLDYSRFSPLEAMAREDEFREIIQALKSNNTVSFESARSLLLSGRQAFWPSIWPIILLPPWSTSWRIRTMYTAPVFWKKYPA